MIRKILPAAGAVLLAAGMAQAQDPEVVVTGQRIVEPVAKLDQPLVNTPQSIDVVTHEEINEQAITSLKEALVDIPSATAHADEDGQQGDNFYIRGFSAENDIYVDGIRDPGHYKHDAFDMQSLEVLEGPSGVVFGRGSTGGAINYVTKQPQLDDLTEGALMLGTDGTKRLTGDLDRALDPETAFRINVMGTDAGVTGRKVVEYSQLGVAPTMSFGIGTPTRLTVEMLHESEYDIPDYGVPWVYTPGNTRPYYTASFYGHENDDFARSNADMATLFGEQDLADWVTIRDRFRYGVYSRAMKVTEPAVNDLVTGPLSSVEVDPVPREVRSHETTIQNQLDAKIRGEIGPVAEDVIAGFEVSRDTTSPTTWKFSGVPDVSLLDPDPSSPFVGTRKLKANVNSSALDEAAYAISTSTWGDFAASLAMRFDRFDASYHQSVAPVANFDHVDELPGYRGALTWHPIEDASVYASYGTSFDPSAEALSLSTATAALAPEKTRAYEVGAKYAPRKNLLLNVAVFRTIQRNLREPDPTDPTTDILIGGARAEGIDLGVHGEVYDHWKVWGGYEYLFATVISSPNGDLGNRLQQAPRHSGRLWTSYEFMDNKLEIGAGYDYVGNRTPTTLVEEFGIMQVAPSYYTVGLMAGYRIDENLRLQFNLANLNDAKYFDAIDDNHVVPGEGRTGYLTLRYRM